MNWSIEGFPAWLLMLLLAAAGAIFARTGVQRLFGKTETLPLRGILIWCVMLGHIGDRAGWGWSWATPAVAVFFFLSGYGLTGNFIRKGAGYLAGFMSRSGKRLGVPLLMVLIPYLIYVAAAGDLVMAFKWFLKSGNTIMPNTWYMYALFFAYATWYLSFRWLRGGGALLMILVILAGYFCVMEMVLDWNFVWTRTIFAFPIGVAFALYEKQIREFIRRHSVMPWALMIMAISGFAVMHAVGEGCGIIRIASRGAVCMIAPSIALILTAVQLPQNPVLNYFGKISFELYLVHGVVIAIAGRFTQMTGMIWAAAVVGVSVAAAHCMHEANTAIGRKFANDR